MTTENKARKAKKSSLTPLSIIRESLLQQKSELLNKSLNFKKTHAENLQPAPDKIDGLVQDLQDNIDLRLHERDRQSLMMISHALEKFAQGTYGTCESCGDEISSSRLQARPLATLCISCMEDLEHAKGKSLQ